MASNTQYKLSEKNKTQLSDYLLLWHPFAWMLFRETTKKPVVMRTKGQSPDQFTISCFSRVGERITILLPSRPIIPELTIPASVRLIVSRWTPTWSAIA